MSESFIKWAEQAKNKKYVILVLILILLVLAITFMPLGDSGGNNKIQAAASQITTQASEDYEETLEKKLETMLSKMEGVGAVNVMITTVSNEEKVLAQDVTTSTQTTKEQDQSGGTRDTDNASTNTQVVLQNGNTPYVVKQYAPDIKGVFVVAEGAGDAAIKNQIIEAVSKVLDVPVHKISVEKKEK